MSNDNTKVEYYRKLLDDALANSEPEPSFVHFPGCISAEQMMLSRTFGGERYCMWCEPCNMAWNAAIDAAREAVAATFIGWCKDYMNCTDYEHVCGNRREIITAIDGLREKR